jgi:hypothetical protein
MDDPGSELDAARGGKVLGHAEKVRSASPVPSSLVSEPFLKVAKSEKPIYRARYKVLSPPRDCCFPPSHVTQIRRRLGDDTRSETNSLERKSRGADRVHRQQSDLPEQSSRWKDIVLTALHHLSFFSIRLRFRSFRNGRPCHTCKREAALARAHHWPSLHDLARGSDVCARVRRSDSHPFCLLPVASTLPVSHLFSCSDSAIQSVAAHIW